MPLITSSKVTMTTILSQRKAGPWKRDFVPITETPLYLSKKFGHQCKSRLRSLDTGILLLCESQLHRSFNKYNMKYRPGCTQLHSNLICQQELAIDV